MDERDRITVREACRRRMPLDGADAECLEHALTITERERDEARLKARAIIDAVERMKFDKCVGYRTGDILINRPLCQEHGPCKVREICRAYLSEPVASKPAPADPTHWLRRREADVLRRVREGGVARCVEGSHMKIRLVFLDWQNSRGDSVYSREDGISLSLGSFHSGSIFDAEIDAIGEEADLEEAMAKGYRPVFYAVARVERTCASCAHDAECTVRLACGDTELCAGPRMDRWEQRRE